MLLLVASFSVSLVSIYKKLDNRITDLTSTENRDHLKHDASEHNMTLTLNNMTDVSFEITKLRQQLLTQADEIIELHNMVEFQINTTVKALNATVEKVQEDVNKQVEEVNENVSDQNSLMAYQFAGTFAILGSLISFWHMAAHIRKLNEPIVQRKIIAIMWMVPIYSVSSWLGLVFVEAQAYLSVFKDVYEAYAIYQFLAFLIAILGKGDREAVITLLATHADHLKPPIRFNPWVKRETFPSPRHKAEAVLHQCQFFTMQFVLLRPVTTIVMVILDAVHESQWDPKYPQFYVMMVVNISIFFAFTGLVRFYHVVKNDIMWCNPFSKFLCIKGIVFMTFWQGIVISFIAHAVYNKNEDINGDYDSTEWSNQAQSFLICLEMFLFAIVHCFVFPTEEWEPGYQEKAKRRIKANFGDTLALRDFVRDVKLVMRSRKGKRRQMEKLPQRDEGLGDGSENGSSLMPGEDDDSIEIDWSHGWGRIEQYIEMVDKESSLNTSTCEENDEGVLPRDDDNSPPEAKYEENDLSLTVENTNISTSPTSTGIIRHRSTSDSEIEGDPHEMV